MRKAGQGMTALKKYQRLECPGLWRETAPAQRREVVVGFREATLVLADPRTDIALTQWSLPAIQRLNPGEEPAIYAPAPDSPETLEIEEPEMVAALETVRGVVVRAQPRPGRLRGIVVAGGTALVVLIGLFWLPGALASHTAAALPAATRSEIGAAALADLARLTGAPCDAPLGLQAADKLANRLFGPEGPRILVLPDGLTSPASLPGGLILLPRSAVEEADGPERAAGMALVQATLDEVQDPMVPVLRQAGTVATFRLLTSGRLDPQSLHGYGEELLRAQSPGVVPVDPELLLPKFEVARVPSSAYAYAVDPTGETTLTLIEADPFKGAPPDVLIPDDDWISLQAICGS